MVGEVRKRGKRSLTSNHTQVAEGEPRMAVAEHTPSLVPGSRFSTHEELLAIADDLRLTYPLTSGRKDAALARGFIALSGKLAEALSAWQPIETAPKMRTILLFAVTDVREDGTVTNWKKATGAWHTGFEDERSKEQGYTPWTWAGQQLKVYDVQPTHWMPLPPGPL